MVQRFASRVREQLDATWGIAELGAAGPSGARYGHPAGTCVLAVVGPVTLTTTVETGSNDREGNMWRFTGAAMNLLERALSSGE
jgi:nicotinamide mononucleotide (NMN) deamidase PncC